MTSHAETRTRAIGQKINMLCQSIEKHGPSTAYAVAQRLVWDDGNARKYCRRALALKLLVGDKAARGMVWRLTAGWREVMAGHGPTERPAPVVSKPVAVGRPGIGTRWMFAMPWQSMLNPQKAYPAARPLKP